MAILGKIRSYSGLLIVVIGVALAAFVLGDLAGIGGGGSQPEAGRIGRDKIMLLDFERRVNEQIESRRAQTGQQTLTQQELAQIRQSTWDFLAREILMDGVLNRNGITVSTEEMQHLLHGPEPHREIIRNFSNPMDGSYDPQNIISFLQNFDMVDPGTQSQWFRLEEFIARDRSETKYFNMVGKGYYMPTLLAKADFADRNNVAKMQFVAKNVNVISDDEVEVSENEIKKAYEKHKATFERPASRGIQYVVFPVMPSQEDRESILERLTDLKDEFEQAQNIESFINANSDIRFNPSLLGREDLSPQLEAELFNAPIGTIYGPFEENNAWVLAKLVDAQMRPDSLRASHLLVSFAGSAASNPSVTRTLNEARQLADSLLGVVRRSPAQFESLIMQFSDDQSAAFNQGDLGWFRETDMVPEFSRAVVEAPVNTFTTAESQFGVHVIRVTGKGGSTRKVQVAKLARNITHSNRTFQNIFGEANGFVNQLRGASSFEDLANEKGLAVREFEVQENTFTFPGIENPRQIVRWAFDSKTNVGSYSQLFDLEDRFVIATLTEKNDEGIPSLEQIRQEITNLAIRDKKFEILEAEMRAAKSAGTLEAIAQQLEIEVSDTIETRFNVQQVPGLGFEPKLIGTLFGMQPGTISQPVKGNNAVAIIEKLELEKAELPEEIESVKRQALTSFVPRVATSAFNAIKNSARIIDNTNQFY